MEFEITLRNHKDTPVTVQVNEPIGGDWEMLSSSYKYDENFGLRSAIPCAGEGQWRIGAEISDSRALVGRSSKANSRPVKTQAGLFVLAGKRQVHSAANGPRRSE